MKEPEAVGGCEWDVLSQMGSVGVSVLCSAGLPCQQAPNASPESRCDKSGITPGGTGESAPRRCVSIECGLQRAWMSALGGWVGGGGYRIISSKSVCERHDEPTNGASWSPLVLVITRLEVLLNCLVILVM